MVKKKEKIETKLIEMKLIDPPDGHVRMEIPEREIFELSESMKEVGLVQAIVITPVNSRYEVVVGHRRYLAAKRLNWGEIKAEVRVMDRREIAILRATENLQRKDLSPIEEAAIYLDLYNEGKLTPKMIAKKMGRGATYVKRRMDLLRLDEEIQKVVHARKISIEVAFILSKIEDKKELYQRLEWALENGCTPQVARMWVDDVRKALQYINTREEPPVPRSNTIVTEKYYTACQICEGPMEYQEIQVIKICKDCLDRIRKGLK